MLNFLEGYQITFKNAIRHLEAAEILSKQKMYGMASSHLILSSEETLKAGMYFAKYYIPHIEIDFRDRDDMIWLINFAGEKAIFTDNVDWWEQVVTTRNRGFYVEPDESNQTWQTPEFIKEKDFFKSRRIVVELLTRFSRLEKAPTQP